jgi:hypothetical protein
MNESKARSPRMWEKWRSFGAVANMETARRKQLYPLPPEGLPIDAIGEHYTGPAQGDSTLSLGRRLVNSGPDWKVFKPVTAVVAPGLGYKLGQVIKEYPEGTRTIEQVFGKR